jgi:tight adherence protein B
VTIATLTAALAAGCVLALWAAIPEGPPPAPAIELGRRGSRPSGRVRRRAGTGRLAVATAALGAFAGWLVMGGVGFAGGALVGGAVPVGLDRRRSARRRREIEEGLIDAVLAIAAVLRSGRSLVQSIAVAAGETEGSLGDVLAGAADRASLGAPLDEVLDDVAERIGGPDARLVTGVLRLHRRTGGALAGALDDLVRTLRARRDGARELRSLTAQARLSAAILGLLPLGFFLFLSVVARGDVESAYRTSAGASAIGLGLSLQAAAFLWIRRLLRVEEA